MIPIYWLSVLLLGASPAHTAAGDDEASKWGTERYYWIMEQYHSGNVESPEGRLSPEQQDREWEATVRLQREWGATVHALVTVLNRSDSELTTYCVIRRLRDMRAEEAVRPLIKQITFNYLGAADWKIPLSEYPAALALVKIGQPAVREILGNRLRLPATDEDLKLLAGVVYGHYMFDSAVGRFHIERVLEHAQKQLKGEKDPKWSPGSLATWQQNLTRVSQFYEAIDRGELFPNFSVP